MQSTKIESSTGVVERVVVVDREVGSVPAVAVPNGGATFVSGVLLFDLHGDTNQESGKLVHDGKRFATRRSRSQPDPHFRLERVQHLACPPDHPHVCHHEPVCRTLDWYPHVS
jgi:hypothetical protein